MRSSVDHDRVRCAMNDILVEGVPSSAVRVAAIEEAIASIQRDGNAALSYGYVGVKNYAGFGDQREDHSYGCGPRHGTIVFRVGRTSIRSAAVLGTDHVYALEALRDAGAIETGTESAYGIHSKVQKNLFEVIAEMDRTESRRRHLWTLLQGLTVESHATARDAA